MSNRARRGAPHTIYGLVVAAAVLCGAVASNAAETAPKVVVSLKPLHSIVAGVMRGVAMPALLVSSAQSPHGYALRPSQARLLQQADAVFWVGPELERFLVKPVKYLSKNAKIVRLGAAVPLLPFRKHALWQAAGDHAGHAGHGHKTAHGHDAAHGHKAAHGHGTRDPHFWLDPLLTHTIVPVIERSLTAIDPANADRYRANARQLEERLQRLHEELDARLAPVRQAPYLVFHDAYQYLEVRYRLASQGTVTLDPERRPGARHLAEIRRKVAQDRVKCLFQEPQFKPSTIAVVMEATAVGLGELDPLGVAQKPGPDAYFKTLEALAENLTKCLGNSGPTPKN